PDNRVKALMAAAERGADHYHMQPDSYINSIIGWYKRKHGWEVKREWLGNTPGIWAAFRICLSAYSKPGDRVIVQTPHFFPINAIVAKAGCHLVTNPMLLENGKYRLDFADFERKIAAQRPSVYFMVNPQNPTCRVFTRDELVELSRICKKYGVVVLSDEVHSNVLYDGNKHHPTPTMSDEAMDNTVLITGASKGYNLMDLTYCLLVIPNPELRRKFEEELTAYNYDFATNIFGMTGLEAAFSEATDDWMRQLNNYLQANLDFLTDFMEKNVPKIRVIRPQGSYLVWLDCRELGMSPAELQTFFLNKAKVGLTWGESYGPAGEGFERLNIGCPRKTLTEGLIRIQNAVNSR
ncbi:MAG: aminotransferase class I/II-fold pyridoxal phosphate-dependent enzyme, partial [Planctomycetes bacterium]|nr:aminotransferase class I/II-fold pyridoxal phosphate-dependent enzyme [Planctomycetota bacterium]